MAETQYATSIAATGVLQRLLWITNPHDTVSAEVYNCFVLGVIPTRQGNAMTWSVPRPDCLRRSVLLLAFVLSFGELAVAADAISPESLQFFESKIRPVLARHCYSCHSAEAKTRMGGLSLDSRDGALRGGQRGEAVVPGSTADSLLLQALSYESDPEDASYGQVA